MDPIELIAGELKAIKERLDTLEKAPAKVDYHLETLLATNQRALEKTNCRANPELLCTWPIFREDDCCGQCDVYYDELEKKKVNP